MACDTCLRKCRRTDSLIVLPALGKYVPELPRQVVRFSSMRRNDRNPIPIRLADELDIRMGNFAFVRQAHPTEIKEGVSIEVYAVITRIDGYREPSAVLPACPCLFENAIPVHARVD